MHIVCNIMQAVCDHFNFDKNDTNTNKQTNPHAQKQKIRFPFYLGSLVTLADIGHAGWSLVAARKIPSDTTTAAGISCRCGIAFAARLLTAMLKQNQLPIKIAGAVKSELVHLERERRILLQVELRLGKPVVVQLPLLLPKLRICQCQVQVDWSCACSWAGCSACYSGTCLSWNLHQWLPRAVVAAVSVLRCPQHRLPAPTEFLPCCWQQLPPKNHPHPCPFLAPTHSLCSFFLFSPSHIFRAKPWFFFQTDGRTDSSFFLLAWPQWKSKPLKWEVTVLLSHNHWIKVKVRVPLVFPRVAVSYSVSKFGLCKCAFF